MISRDEETLRESFWDLRDSEEVVVQGILYRRFPEACSLLSRSLEAADPMDVVYPGNPDEYSDVVREVIVLLAHVNGDTSRLTEGELESILVEGLSRCFGEKADLSNVKRAVRLLRKFSADD